MEKIGKYLLGIGMWAVLTACPPRCDLITLDFGELSGEVLEMVPYIHGASYGFRHSAGQEVYFLVDRQNSVITDFWEECTQVTYGTDHTIMMPDYPLFDMGFWIYKVDSIHVMHQATIGTSTFILPLTQAYDPGFGKLLDSVKVSGKWFRDVYRVIPLNSAYQTQGEILADTLWFNTDFGILKFTMTGGEYFEILP
ncbi:MAG: hypothetical protein R6W31_03310 [Bacteroidales bacterium]